MIARPLLLTSLLFAAACGSIPRDQEGTLDRITAERQFKVGLIAAAEPIGMDRQRALLNGIRAATGARPVFERGASEPVLARLETGEIDLVLGELSPESPWGKQLSIMPPLGEQVTADGHVHLVAVARNGENAWISLLHREAAKVAARP